MSESVNSPVSEMMVGVSSHDAMAPQHKQKSYQYLLFWMNNLGAAIGDILLQWVMQTNTILLDV